MPIIRGNDRANTLNGGVGADAIFGRGGNDRIFGGFGGDRLVGEAGDDSLFGNRGSDTLDGGDGDDRLTPGANIDYDAIEASFGSDTIDFVGADVDSDYEVYYSLFERVVVRIDATSATVQKFVNGLSGLTRDSTDRFVNVDKIDADLGYLYIGGTAGDDVFTVQGRIGARISIGVGLGDNIVTGAARTFEQVNLQAPFVQSTGSDEDEDWIGMEVRITSSTATGQMTGTARNLAGESTTTRFSAVDVIRGTFKADVFIGAAGNDHFETGEGSDGMDGGAGFDTVSYNNTRFIETRVDLALGETRKVFLRNDGRRFYDDGLVNVEAVIGAPNGRDLLRGSAVANPLDGQGDNDRLEGRAGDDTLIGGDGNDVLRGDAGRDRYVFDGDDGDDRIVGFQNGLDRIQITEGARRFADLSIAQVGGNVVIDFEDTTITLVRVNRSAIDAGDFLLG